MCDVSCVDPRMIYHRAGGRVSPGMTKHRWGGTGTGVWVMFSVSYVILGCQSTRAWEGRVLFDSSCVSPGMTKHRVRGKGWQQDYVSWNLY